MDELSRARYIALTTYKRDGSAKTTPVWVTGSEGTYAFTTGADAWKARRLRRNPNVEVRACDMRGRSTAEATRFVGTGEVLDTPDAVAGHQVGRGDQGPPGPGRGAGRRGHPVVAARSLTGGSRRSGVLRRSGSVLRRQRRRPSPPPGVT
jgi:hypothetical protein